MKHKIGDKITIKKDLRIHGEYSMENAKEKEDIEVVVEEMEEFFGKEAVITMADESGYNIDIDGGWYWVDEMFE